MVSIVIENVSGNTITLDNIHNTYNIYRLRIKLCLWDVFVTSLQYVCDVTAIRLLCQCNDFTATAKTGRFQNWSFKCFIFLITTSESGCFSKVNMYPVGFIILCHTIYIIYSTYNTCWLIMKPRLWDVKDSANAHALRIS